MELHTAQWDRYGGWSAPFPAWDGDRTLVLAYGSAGAADDPAALRDLAAAYPGSCVLGCSTAGEIFADTVSDDTLSVAVVRFASTVLKRVDRPVAHPDDSYDAGRELGIRLAAGEAAPGGVFVLSDGLGVNGSALTAGLVEGTGGRVPVTGGMAGDGDRFQRTWVLVDGEPRGGFVTAVGLSGPDLAFGHGSRGGWDIFGPERRVTRSAGNVLYELDNQPALELYTTYLGERATELPAAALLFPLAVRVPGADERQLVRTIIGIDPEAKSMTFAGDVPVGARAQLMRANFDRLIEASQEAAEAAEPAADAATLAVAISCVGRRLLLGRRTEDELEAALAGLPDGTGMVGFYSYGEISPIAAGSCDLHNQTMTMTTIQER